MEPLQPVPMPTHAVLVGINTANSWPTATAEGVVRRAYVATNSTTRQSFCSLQSAPNVRQVLQLATRPSKYDDMPYGLVVEVYLAKDIAAGETVYLTLAQSGATTYYPPQQIDDAK